MRAGGAPSLQRRQVNKEEECDIDPCPYPLSR
jgi:hypothetical protein